HSIIEGSITCLHTFFFNDTAPTAIYTLSYTTLFRSEALAHRGEDLFGEGVLLARAEAHVQRRTEHVRRNGFLDCGEQRPATFAGDRKSTRLNSSHDQTSYAVFCLKKKNRRQHRHLPL